MAIVGYVVDLINEENVPWTKQSTMLDIITNYSWQIECMANAYCLWFERDYAKSYYRHCCMRVHFIIQEMFRNIVMRRTQRLESLEHETTEFGEAMGLAIVSTSNYQSLSSTYGAY